MLYDTTADVIRKALRGLDMAPSQAAALCGLPEREVLAASRGPAAREILLRLAPALDLGPEALADLPDYSPPACRDSWITRLELPFADETVNAWLLDARKGSPLLFDAGNGRNDAKDALREIGVAELDVLITHEHGDHVGGLVGMKGVIRSLAGENLNAGDILVRGDLMIRVIALPGHCVGAVGYVVERIEPPVCVTGDALFAGSIGGCAPGEPYRQALDSLRKEVMTLPDETLLLPGHGPATTVGSERTANPFLARR